MLTTMATWLLLVQLHAPLNPSAEAQWDMRYSQFETPEHCEVYAKEQWAKYNAYYAGSADIWMQTFNTTCSASTKTHDYKWFIQCDKLNNCSTIKYKGPRV